MELGEPAILYGDFASGPRCEIEKGGPPTSRRIEPGDLLLLDFSVVVSGYRGDFTNTFAVGQRPDRSPARTFRGLRGRPSCRRSQLEARRQRAQSIPQCAATSTRSNSPTLSPAIPATASAWAIPSRLTSFPTATIPSSSATSSPSSPASISKAKAGCGLSETTSITADGFQTLSHHEIRITQ